MTEFEIWLSGFLLITIGAYLLNRFANFTIQFQYALLSGIGSWFFIAIILGLATIGFFLWLLTESPPIQYIEKWFNPKG